MELFILFGIILLVTLPLLLWLPVTRWLVGPLLKQSENSTRPTQYFAVDFMPLVFQLSIVGAIVSKALSLEVPALSYLAVLLLAGEAFGSWWLSVRCLSIGGVTSLARRFLFQLAVVPIGVFWPLVIVAIPASTLTAANAWQWNTWWKSVAIGAGVLFDLTLLWIVYRTSRWVIAEPRRSRSPFRSDGWSAGK